MDPEALLAGLDASQRAAVTEPTVPLAIHAGAGSGKTRVLTHRIAWHAATERLDPGHVLALTFTRKAAGELRDRLGRLGVRGALAAGTFHSVALAQLRRRHADRGTTMPTVLASKGRIVGPLLGSRGRDGGRDSGLTLAEAASEIEWAKARLVPPPRYLDAVAAAARDVRRPEQAAKVYEGYEREKRRRGVVDFDDLLLECALALEQDTEFAAVQRWRFRHLFVDEFQDTTRAQLRLLRLWLGDRRDLCVVGDPDQAIYGFAGADPSYLTRFEELFPGGVTVRLDHNYRSTPQVVAASRAVLPRERARLTVETPLPDGPVPTIQAYDDEHTEAAAVARAIVASQGPDRPWSSMAVLYRTNAQSAAFEEAFARRHVPFRVRGAAAFLDRPEVRAVLDELRSAAKASPTRPFADHVTDLVTDAVDGPEERREHAEAVAALGREYLDAEGGQGSVDGFLMYLSTALRGDDAGDQDPAVELLTFHAAKGLEWDSVFVTGLEKGLVPIKHAEDRPAELAEEQRLLYVALSRARRTLHLSHAEQRTFGVRAARRQPSPYLDAVAHVLAGRAPGDIPEIGAAVNKRGAAAARKQLAGLGAGDVSPTDRPLYDALVEWRRTVARAADVPAYVVFDNKTLRALAETRPDSRTELLSVPGIGPTKMDRYGEAVLEVVRAHPTRAD